ncbi:DUF433 domain-containing protein [Microseira wollei]|uniref:DUF433 domain-containing protein n=1 Tax=Microseira wollei NIES-4236 TaxID=2530354 RepID=A0AAV3XBZ0_9CYAN|nr:DUF433 domain-containing protein [Microseira wollei]GET38156.1 hypothetical protein MiSe_29100 [Microseira wollei NIES-4236]
MQLEDYFDFLAPKDIRIKGTRVGIESILYEYIHRKLSPEEIVPKFRTVTLEQVYATILYYLHNKETIGKYFADWLEWSHQQWKNQEMNPHPAIIRLRERIAKYGRDPEVHKALRRQRELAAPGNIKEVVEKHQNDSLSNG